MYHKKSGKPSHFCGTASHFCGKACHFCSTARRRRLSYGRGAQPYSHGRDEPGRRLRKQAAGPFSYKKKEKHIYFRQIFGSYISFPYICKQKT